MTIAKQIAKGAAWILFFKLVSRGIGLISIVVLARLLSPADFGLVAIAMALISALELAGNFSFEIALIQNQNATRQHYDTVWTITLVFQTAISLLLALSAFPIAGLFEESRLGPALLTLAIVPILQGLKNIKIVDFRKKMMFQKDFTFLLSVRVIGFLVTIPLAFYLQNYWALIIGTLASRMTGLILSYVLIPYKPQLGTAHWKELFSFSKWMFANNILFFLRHRASSFIIGKISGVQNLGVFEVANEISSIPTTELVAPINRAVLPGLSKINNDLSQFGDNYLQIAGIIVLLATPAGIGIAAVAEPLVHVALGSKWLDAIPIISILGLVGGISCTETNTATTCIAIGRPDLVTKLYLYYVTILLILTVWFTLNWGIIGTARAWLLASILYIPACYTVALNCMNIRLRRFFGVIWRPIAACVFMFFGVRWFLARKIEYSGSLDALPMLVGSIAVGALIYAVSIAALWYLTGRPTGAEQDIWNQVVARLKFGKETAGE